MKRVLLLLVVVAALPVAPAAAKPLRAPALQSPAAGADVGAVPAFRWGGVRGASSYEFQLAADRGFGSIVLGRGQGSFKTANTAATVASTLADGDYWWRVRAINAKGRAGSWSDGRTLRKRWSDAPALTGPVGGLPVSFPVQSLVLQWTRVPGAARYIVDISADATLATPAPGLTKPVETSGSQYALPSALAPGRYYWAVTPVDAQGHRGTRSATGSFVWVWETHTQTRLADLNEDPRVFDPQFSWDPVPGASAYSVEVNVSEDFAVGSKVCCADTVTGTSLSPRKVLANNRYHWRVRAIDADKNPGAWNVGGSFDKAFDAVSPTVPGLHLRDNVSDPAVDLGGAPVPTLNTPILVWDPVPGASSYEVQLTPYESGCNWTSKGRREFVTASTAWTPLSPRRNGNVPGGVAWDAPASDVSAPLVDGTTYCVRAAARSDRTETGDEVVSDWTQLNGLGNAAFRFRKATVATASGPLTMPAGNYRSPQAGSVLTRLPLFTWTPVTGAQSYFVVVAKDPAFTTILDLALTQVPAYAPRAGTNVWTYPDETTSLYWAVMPATSDDGNGVTSVPQENSPQPFEKRSNPPELLTPAEGSDVSEQPTFRWTPAEGAREYRIQVAQDASFGDPLDDVTTAALAYTSTTTYPVDSVLYWRVRANDERRIGLRWSSVGSFRRRLPAPTPAAGNPTEGGTIPLLTWSPVQGAISYDLHVDQADGTRKDFTLRAPAFTPTTFYGTGIWRWQVRANFPAGLLQRVSGPYSPLTPFTRRIAAPTGMRAESRKGRLVFSWDHVAMAKRYLVEVSESNSFSQIGDQLRTDHTTWAPDLAKSVYARGVIHWRVAAVDEGNNPGGFATGSLRLGRTLRVRAIGKLKRGRRSPLTVMVTNGAGRGIRGAKVSVRGARRTRTNATGRAVVLVKPRRQGKLGVIVSKKGYGTARTTARVR